MYNFIVMDKFIMDAKQKKKALRLSTSDRGKKKVKKRCKTKLLKDPENLGGQLSVCEIKYVVHVQACLYI